MQTSKEKMKSLLDRVKEVNYRRYEGIQDFEKIVSRISLEEFMIFFDVLEAHYLAHGLMEEYLNDMISNMHSILIFTYLNNDLSNAEILANTQNIVCNHFDSIERNAIAHEIIDKIEGIDYLQKNEFELMSDKSKRLLKGKKYVISFDNNHFSMSGPV